MKLKGGKNNFKHFLFRDNILSATCTYYFLILKLSVLNLKNLLDKSLIVA